MLLGAGRFLDLVDAYRLVYIAGRFGGGKTSLAFKIAEFYLQRGYRLLSNVRSVWNDTDFPEGRFGERRCVVILDEGGQFVRDNSDLRALAAYVRKMDLVMIIPSFFEPPRAFQVLRVWPWFGFRHVRVPVVVYRYRLGWWAGFKESGWFVWVWPNEIFGVYSTLDPADDRVYDVLAGWSQRYRERYGRRLRGSERVRDGADLAEMMGGVVDEFRDVLEAARRRRRVL